MFGIREKQKSRPEDCCTKTDQFGDIACEYNMEDILFLWLQAK